MEKNRTAKTQKTTLATKVKGKGGQPATQTTNQNQTQVQGNGANTKGGQWRPNQTRQKEPRSASDPKGKGKKKGKM